MRPHGYGIVDSARVSRYSRPMKPAIDISQLSPAECILLAEQLWERARSHPEAVPVTDVQMTELNRRLDALERGEMPPGEPWEIVRKRLWGE